MIIHLSPLILATIFMTAKLFSNCVFYFFGSCCHCRFFFLAYDLCSIWHAIPPPPPPSLPQTHHAFCCLCGRCRPCDGHRGAGMTRRFERAQVLSAGGVSGCPLFCQLPLFSPPHTPDIQTHTLTQNTLAHTQAWPEFIDKLKQVRG